MTIYIDRYVELTETTAANLRICVTVRSSGFEWEYGLATGFYVETETEVSLAGADFEPKPRDQAARIELLKLASRWVDDNQDLLADEAEERAGA